MEKLMQFITDTVKAVLPPAADLLKKSAGMLLSMAGNVAKLVMPAAKEGTKKLVQRKADKKLNRILRKTAVISGGVMALSVVGLIVLRKK